MDQYDVEEHVSRIIQRHGGREEFFSRMESRLLEFNAIWDQDTQSIGRVLSSHLAVEHFLTELIAFENPRLAPIENARLTFAQKVELLPDDDRCVSFLKPSLRRLNAVRNRLAHKLRVDINEEDRSSLLGIPMFAAMRRESARREGPKPDDPLSVVEQFAMFAAGLLHARANPERDLWM